MSQIAGILRFNNGVVSDEEVRAQKDPLATAPHDRFGIWRGESVALMHFALDIADEDALDRQPVFREDVAATLVWDGRLFNRAELYGLLPDLLRHPLNELPDSRIVLEAWLRWGKNCLPHIVGDFAFAVWNSREKELFLARDRMGMRPVYFAKTGRMFAFASQIKGVRDLPDVDRSLDEEWVADYLTLTHLSLENTAYVGIRRLPAAHWMTIAANGKVRTERYWRLRDEPVVKFKKDQDYYDHVREVTIRAVHDRMPGRGPVGSMLSGGLDSSTVTAFACQKARAEGRRVVTVSSVLPEGHPDAGTDERRYMDTFLGQYPECEWVPVSAPGKHFLSDIDELLAICDQPVRDAFHYITFALVDSARSSGARTVLTGMGGDFFISSRLRGGFARMLVTFAWLNLLKQYCAARKGDAELTAGKFVRSSLLSPMIRTSIVGKKLELLGIWPKLEPRLTAADNKISRRLKLNERLRIAVQRNRYSSWRKFLFSDEQIACSGTVVHLLEFFAGVGITRGMQLECPLFDYRLIAVVANLPLAYRFDAALPRPVIRKIALNAIPDMIRLRTDKLPFSPDTTHRARMALHDGLVLSAYESRAQAYKGIVDWDQVKETASVLRAEAGWIQDFSSIALIFTAVSLVHMPAKIGNF